jgi:hypothetical protein
MKHHFSILSLLGAVGFCVLGSGLTGGLTGCASDVTAEDDDTTPLEADLQKKTTDQWFYSGPLPALENTSLVVSLKGHTARITGTLPAGITIPDLPHLRRETTVDGKQLVHFVYPIATARPGKSNSTPGVYRLEDVRPFRPDGKAITRDEGEHFVPWGGFPFIAYNQGIAFHGPITSTDPTPPIVDEFGAVVDARAGDEVFTLLRGAVSGGCNRMMGEHVVELSHLLGVNMRKVYAANQYVSPSVRPNVTVSAEYDQVLGKAVDVDYPTDVGAVRPHVALMSRDKVEMFGSWVATERNDGKDLAQPLKWEGGVKGKLYTFSEHAKKDWVCSMPQALLPRLGKVAKTLPGGLLPADFCAKRACVVDALSTGKEAKSVCRL